MSAIPRVVRAVGRLVLSLVIISLLGLVGSASTTMAAAGPTGLRHEAAQRSSSTAESIRSFDTDEPIITLTF
jgi:hypothetical protein